jgi:hypothetical protein
VGPLAVVGAIQDGRTGDYEALATIFAPALVGIVSLVD